MTYPKVHIQGEDLPEPFSGWDDREMTSPDGSEAVYFPSRFEFIPDAPFLYMEWASDEVEERRWIHTDKIESVDSTHDHLEDER